MYKDVLDKAWRSAHVRSVVHNWTNFSPEQVKLLEDLANPLIFSEDFQSLQEKHNILTLWYGSFIGQHSEGAFLVFNHLNRLLDLVQLCLDRLFEFNRLNR